MKLQEIQKELKAPKNQFNNFGKYHYRSCEDILEAVKPLLGDSILLLSDTVKECGGMVFIEATASFHDGGFSKTVTACAGVEHRKGMDLAQSFGASSSYARKYALNGLFLIDDNKDSDQTNNKKKNEGKGDWVHPEIATANIDELRKIWESNPDLQTNKVFKNEVAKRKAELGAV